MALIEERKGEIALTLLKHSISKERNLRLAPHRIIEKIEQEAKETGIPKNEAAKFSKELVIKVVAETLIRS